MSGKIYGYVRVSTKRQKLERQIENIRRAYPTAIIVSEKYTGTTLNRPAWSKLYKKLGAGDTVVFDEVSRMSRDAVEGFATYKTLYERSVNMVFLKEPHINSDVYRDTMQIKPTGTDADFDETVIPGLNAYLMRLAERQIKIAFEQAQAEVDHLHQRVKEGMEKNGAAEKISEARTGATYETKKAKAAKETILKYCKDFGNGTLNDVETMQMIGKISRGSYYKYKRELLTA